MCDFEVPVRSRQGHLARAGIWVLALWGFLCLGAQQARAAEAELEQNVQTIRGVQILPAEHTDAKRLPSKFYYLPPSIRLTTDSNGKPSILLVKYNLPEDVGYTV